MLMPFILVKRNIRSNKNQGKARKSKGKQGKARKINGKSYYFGTKFCWFQSAEAKKLAKICKQNASIFKRIQETTDFRPCIFNDFQGSFKDFGSDITGRKKTGLRSDPGNPVDVPLLTPCKVLDFPFVFVWKCFCFCLQLLD